MAKIIFVYNNRNEEETMTMKISKRQLAVGNGENLMMLMELKNLVFDHPAPVKGRELDVFSEKYKLLSKEELKHSLEVSTNEFNSVLSQTVDCVGCRRSVERLFLQLKISGHPTLDPLVINKQGVLSISNEKLKAPRDVCTLLSDHDVLLSSILEHQPRNKKNHTRCSLHSLDSFRSRPFSEMWRDVWDEMKDQCKEEVTVIETKDLQATLDGYLKKHKFCPECRTKVDKAYSLLVSENNAPKEKGYVAALYSGIKRCLAEKHIHLQTKTDYIDSLIRRAELELNGRHRERHAKTLEIAQEEVLTCIGMCIYERLRKIHVYLREEENACQVLGAVAVHALSRNFDTAVEKKRGISNLELLYEEISREEKLKEQKKEQKKMKKRKKKERKNLVSSSTPTSSSCPLSANCESTNVPQKCVCSSLEHDDEDGNSDDDSAEEYQIVMCDGMVVDGTGPLLKSSESTKCNNPVVIESMDSSSSSSNGTKDDTPVSACHSCDNKSYSKSSDNSYGLEQQHQEHQEKRHRHHEGSCSSMLSSAGNSRTSSLASSSPEGSEIACSDGFCNHDQSNTNNNNNPLSNNKNFHAKFNGVGTNGCCRPDSMVDSGDRCGFTLSLEQMLDDSHSDDDEVHGNCIPDELIRQFKSRNNQIQQKREELRQKLIKNFNQLCINQRSKAQNSKII